MGKRLLPLWIVLGCLAASTAAAQDAARVLVLPFDINAPSELNYLQQDIPKAIERNLTAEGASVLEPEAAAAARPITADPGPLRRMGRDAGADFVIWGSFTRIGQQFSLDARILETFSSAPADGVYAEGGSIEALPGTVEDLTRRLGVFIFRQQTVADVVVEGNRRIEADAIKRIIRISPGDVYQAQDVSRDLKAIYEMGYFDDIRVESEEGPEGRTLIFKVKEKPTIRIIRFKGNDVFDEDELMENLSISTGAILNIFKLEQNVKRIETLYQEKNYHNAEVTYQIYPLENEQADLEFVIEEGSKTWIREITFEGNEAFSDKELKKAIQTSEKGLLSWFTSSGDLNEEELQQDVERLTAFYNNHGYIQAKVSDPTMESREDGIAVSFKVDEGPRFRVGSVDITGDIEPDRETVLGKIDISGEEFYNREVVRNDVLALSDLYSDQGYAYAEIVPQTQLQPDEQRVDIRYEIDKGKLVHFERIIIEGNTRTRDKVIRRELDVYEQELYSGVRLKEGIRNLHQLDYFEEVKVNTEKGSTDDSMILRVGVAEKPTGTFSFGGGYSNDESFFIVGSVNQRNLFGRGQMLELRAQVGGRSTRFNLNFVEPWFLDTQLSAGINLYNWEHEYNDYTKDAWGSVVKFSYPVFLNTRASLAYTFENATVKDIEEDAAETIQELEGENVTSSLRGGLRWDSRDHPFAPTEGSVHSISVEYAGLGGDISFTKTLAETGWYFPLFWSTTAALHAEGGYVTEGSDGFLPDYEKFYLGGSATMRGYDYQSISVTDENGAEIGGEKYIMFNFEYIFPLVKEAGVSGVIFTDLGNVYREDDSIDLADLRQSVGLGFRWLSPVGPIRVEYGYIIDPREDDPSGGWVFGMGSLF